MNACDACIVQLFGVVQLFFFLYTLSLLGGALQPMPVQPA